MAHYAYINPYTNQVEKVLVIEKKQIKSGMFGDPNNFVECSYNRNVGKLFPGVGYHYIRKSINSKIKAKNVFLPPRPYISWIFNENSWSWQPPIPYPNDNKINYVWNERNRNWIPEIKTINIRLRPNKYCVLNENYQWEHIKPYLKRKIKDSRIVRFLKNLLF